MMRCFLTAAPTLAPTLLLALLTGACADGDDTPSTAERDTSDLRPGPGERDAEMPEAMAVDDGCRAEELEADLKPPALAGPGVVDGELMPGDYAISTTYLRLHPDTDTKERFFATVGAVLSDAREREGLVAMSLALSDSCATARTLTVWKDEAAMYGFATGPAHAKAMAEVGELSRGGSIAMHWLGPADGATWDEALNQLAEFDGRLH